MKRFLLLYVGPPLNVEEAQTPPLTQAALSSWAQQAGNAIVDRGNLLGPSGMVALDTGNQGWLPFPLYGYSIVQAEDINQANEIAKRHPLLSMGTDGKYEVQVLEIITGEIPASALVAPVMVPNSLYAPDQPPPGYDESKLPPLPNWSGADGGQDNSAQANPGQQPYDNQASQQNYNDQPSSDDSYQTQSPDGELSIQHEEPQPNDGQNEPQGQPGQVIGPGQGKDPYANQNQNPAPPQGPYQPQQNPQQQGNMPLPPSQQGPPPPLPPQQRQGGNSTLNKPGDPLVM